MYSRLCKGVKKGLRKVREEEGRKGMVETVWRHAEVKLKLITLIKCAKRRGVDERSFASLFREIPKDVE